MPIQKVNIPDNSMISIIRNHIKTGKGLSLARIGDGEIHILNNRLTPHLKKLFTTVFGYEKYLSILPTKFRVVMSKLRLSSHNLRIETGRYARNHIERQQRYCTICNKLDIEDEYHFVLICAAYNDIRKRYIKPYYYKKPSVIKFNELMESTVSGIVKKS